MTQDAIVTKCLPNGMAEVVVTRTTACGSNCGNCGETEIISLEELLLYEKTTLPSLMH